MTTSDTHARICDLHDEITAAISSWDAQRWSEQWIDSFALELHAAQRAAIPAYDRWCEHELRGRVSDEVTGWRDVPALPIGAFKQLHVAAPGLEDAACWESSGTTGRAASRHHLHALGAYDASIDAGVSAALVPDVTAGAAPPLRCIQLQPASADAPTSSLSHMLDRVRTSAWCRDGGTWVDGRYRLDSAGAWRQLAACEAAGEPVLLLATSFALAQLLDASSESTALRLPAGSRVMDTGGFKGRTREVPRDELLTHVRERLGVEPGWCENEYGMSELSSQAWLGTIARACGHSLTTVPPHPHVAPARWTPPWLLVRVVDPTTLAEVADGDTGLLEFHDLANVWSCAAVRSEDLGVRRGGSFELLGRAPGAELRGCSLRLEDVAGPDHGRRDAEQRTPSR